MKDNDLLFTFYDELKEQKLYLVKPTGYTPLATDSCYKIGEKLILNNGEIYGRSIWLTRDKLEELYTLIYIALQEDK